MGRVVPLNATLATELIKPLSIAELPEGKEKLGELGSVVGALTNVGLIVFTILPVCVNPGAVPPINLVPPDPLAKARLFLIETPVQLAPEKSIPCGDVDGRMTAFS